MAAEMVSILVFLDQALKGRLPVRDRRRLYAKVSILVFLDQALKGPTKPGTRSMAKCFNPCFPGSSAESLDDDGTQGYPLSFNPCFPGSSAERIPTSKTSA